MLPSHVFCRDPMARRVRPHSDFYATGCPGDGLWALIKLGFGRGE